MKKSRLPYQSKWKSRPWEMAGQVCVDREGSTRDAQVKKGVSEEGAAWHFVVVRGAWQSEAVAFNPVRNAQ